MAEIKAYLKINDVGNGELISFTSDEISNNLSLAPYSNSYKDVIENFSADNMNFGGAKGTPIGITTINDLRFGVEDSNGVRSNNYNGIDLGYTDSNGYKRIVITIEGQDIIAFAIYFDKLRGQYPTNYIWTSIDGVAHSVHGNTSDVINFEQVAGYGTTTIVFGDWALPNTSIGITYIENVEIDMTLNKQWIKRFVTQSQLTSDGSQISYGILANTGSISLKDIDNKLYNRATMGHLNTYLFTLDLEVNNNRIASHITNQSPYYSNERVLELTLTNVVDRWNKIEVAEKVYSTQTTLLDVLAYILTYIIDNSSINDNKTFLNDNATMCVDIREDDTIHLVSTYSILSNIIIPPFTLNKGSVVEQINKVCMVAEMYCIEDDDGNPIFYQSRPIVSSSLLNSLDIPFKDQTKVLDYDILVNNRFEDVEIE